MSPGSERLLKKQSESFFFPPVPLRFPFASRTHVQTSKPEKVSAHNFLTLPNVCVSVKKRACFLGGVGCSPVISFIFFFQTSWADHCQKFIKVPRELLACHFRNEWAFFVESLFCLLRIQSFNRFAFWWAISKDEDASSSPFRSIKGPN